MADRASAAPAVESVLQRRLTLSDMLDLPSFAEVCRGFVELYRIGVKVFEENGPKLVDLKPAGAELCSYVFEIPEGRARCTRSVARIKDGPLTASEGARAAGANGLLAVDCFTGCRHLVLPIRHEGEVLGRAVFGPFIPEELQKLPAAAVEALGGGFDLGRGMAILQQMRRAPESLVAKVMQQFAAILETLIFAGQKVLLTSEVHIESEREAFRDMEQKNRELVATNARLRELDRLKSNFLATISHELRTPLTSIIGYSEMLAQGMAGQLNAEQDEYVQTILEKGETLLTLISSILDVTQIDAGRIRIAWGPCDLNELAQQAVTAMAPAAQKKELQLETLLAPGLRTATADRDKLRQCLINLISNSVKFTPLGGRIKVAVLPESPAGMLPEGVAGLAVTVEDNGIGIPADQLERIFESFYQVDQGSTRQYGGAGIGLAIVKSFVEAHGGRVRVESALNKWSRFTIAIPYAPDKMPEPDSDAPF